MSITLNPEQETIVDNLIATGSFQTAEEVLQVALNLLEYALHLLNDEQDYDPLWSEETKEKVAIGLAQIDNGQVLEVSSIIEKLKQKVQNVKDLQG
jgi:antitoxin ParD1/3/4